MTTGTTPETANAVTADVPQSVALEINETVAGFLELHEQLVAVLREENDVLKQKNFTTLTDLISRKGPLIELYQSALRYLQHNATVVKGLASHVKDKLAEAREEMAHLTSQNMLFLDRAMKSSERLTNMIVDAMKDAKRTSTFYGNGGAMREDADIARSMRINSVV